jgi:four helix bundle protein
MEYSKLEVWIESRKLVNFVYEVSINFLHISRGSLYELETQCYLALDQKYINEIEFNTVFQQIQVCKKLLNGFINYYKKLI